jgi:hypothetical protein
LDICCRNKKWRGDDVSFVILQSVSVTNIKNGCHKQQCPYYCRILYRPEFILIRVPYVTPTNISDFSSAYLVLSAGISQLL